MSATVRNPELREGVAALGASVLAPEEFVDQGPFDVILELVGATNLAGNLRSLATGGRLAVIGVGAGAVGEINLGLLMNRRARIHGSTLRPATARGEGADRSRRRTKRAAATRRRDDHSPGRGHLPTDPGDGGL